jgi:hypothetical protein
VRAALLLVPITLLLAACGGEAVSLDPVARAAGATSKEDSAHVGFTGSSTANGIKVDILGSGDFATAGQQGQLNIQFRSPQTSGTIRELLMGSSVYMISPLFQASLPQGKAWVKIDLKKAGRSSSFDVGSFSAATPAQTLALLQQTGTVVKVGTEMIAGTTATHYRATIDPRKVKDKRLADVTYQPVEVWIDGDDHVRRLHLAYSAGTAGTSEMTMNFSQFGRPLHITLPDESVIWDATSVAAATLKNGGTG